MDASIFYKSLYGQGSPNFGNVSNIKEIFSIDFVLGSPGFLYKRTVYSILGWAGDIGGLAGIFSVII